MARSFIQTEAHYERLRRAALDATQIAVNTLNPSVRVTGISQQAIADSKLWEDSALRKVDWPWSDGYSGYRASYPDRFEIALWHNSKLVALSLGRPTKSKSGLRLDFVEAAPSDLAPERPEVFPFVIIGYETYARLIGATQIRIMNPINAAVASYYERFGYTYVRDGDYMLMEL
jgi:hypothetical protein